MTDALLRHFQLSRHPFGRDAVTAIYRHPGFAEAHERLRITAEMNCASLLVAEPGCGKSLLLGQLADEFRKERAIVHYFAHATVGPFGLVNVLARKVGLQPRRSRAETATAVADALLEDSKRHLLVIDEAHLLPDDSLEDLRLLSIADFDRKSLFLLILAGQPSLDERLAEPTHHALDQRITTVARLGPLSLDETREYVRVRLDASGVKARPVFEDDAVAAVFDAAAGVPRRINRIAAASMIVTAARRRSLISAQDVHDARADRGRA